MIPASSQLISCLCTCHNQTRALGETGEVRKEGVEERRGGGKGEGERGEESEGRGERVREREGRGGKEEWSANFKGKRNAFATCVWGVVKVALAPTADCKGMWYGKCAWIAGFLHRILM